MTDCREKRVSPQNTRRVFERLLLAHLDDCPLGYIDNRPLRHRATTDADVARWLKRMVELTSNIRLSAKNEAVEWPLSGKRRRALMTSLAGACVDYNDYINVSSEDLAALLGAADENMDGIMRRGAVVSFLDWLRRNEATCPDLARQMAAHFGLERELEQMEKEPT